MDRSAAVLVNAGDYYDGREALLLLLEVGQFFPTDGLTLSATEYQVLCGIKARISALTKPWVYGTAPLPPKNTVEL